MTILTSPVAIDEATTQRMVEEATLTLPCGTCGHINIVEPGVILVEDFLGGGTIRFSAIFGSAADFCDKCDGSIGED